MYMYIYIIIICINIHQCQPQHQRLKSTTIHYHHLPSSHRSSLNKHVESTPAARQLFTVLGPVDVHPGGLQLAKTGQRHVVVTPGIQTSGEMGFWCFLMGKMIHPGNPYGYIELYRIIHCNIHHIYISFWIDDHPRIWENNPCFNPGTWRFYLDECLRKWLRRITSDAIPSVQCIAGLVGNNGKIHRSGRQLLPNQLQCNTLDIIWYNTVTTESHSISTCFHNELRASFLLHIFAEWQKYPNVSGLLVPQTRFSEQLAVTGSHWPTRDGPKVPFLIISSDKSKRLHTASYSIIQQWGNHLVYWTAWRKTAEAAANVNLDQFGRTFRPSICSGSRQFFRLESRSPFPLPAYAASMVTARHPCGLPDVFEAESCWKGAWTAAPRPGCGVVLDPAHCPQSVASPKAGNMEQSQRNIPKYPWTPWGNHNSFKVQRPAGNAGW